MPDKRENLQAKLRDLREKEVEHTKRIAALGDIAGSDTGLNDEQRSELQELETKVTESRTAQTDLERILKAGNFSPAAGDDLGLSGDEIRSFSLRKLIIATLPRATREEREAASLEIEASEAVAKSLGVPSRGAMVPNEIMRGTKADRQARGAEQRDLQAGVFGSAGALVGLEQPLPLIELLRNNMILQQLGATFIDGLVGDVLIPKHLGAAQAYWVSGDGLGALTESQQSFGQISMTPKYVGAMTDYSRQLLDQTSIGVENFIRMDHTAVLAIEKDRVAFHGDGEGQPTGIENTTGVQAQTFATASDPTRAEIIEMTTKLLTSNVREEDVAFAINPTIRGNMMNKVVDAGSGKFLMEDNGTAIGKRFEVSNQIATDRTFYGHWRDLVVGEWGTLDFIVDQYTQAANLLVRVIGVHACDSAVRRGESFCVGSN